MIQDIIGECVPSHNVVQEDRKEKVTVKAKAIRSMKLKVIKNHVGGKLRTHARRVKTKINKAIHTVKDKDEQVSSTASSIGTMTATKMARLTRSKGSRLLETVLTKSVSEFIRERKRSRSDEENDDSQSSVPAKKSRVSHEVQGSPDLGPKKAGNSDTSHLGAIRKKSRVSHEVQGGPDHGPMKAGSNGSSHLGAIRKKRKVHFSPEKHSYEDDIPDHMGDSNYMKTTSNSTSAAKKRKIEDSCEPRNVKKTTYCNAEQKPGQF